MILFLDLCHLEALATGITDM